ncbi:uncharacterized protein LOC130714576 isoform X2 [Lotus japonicus]|uniref:uncharacterized protein LOC130714576 isoform X2 n=1 Tax=Lotus japonicus TaxID=34305 RepID=UPI00258742D8|nr:uncharacterized protein LOC130714576 isoform X2 [Lotus japonicus]
MAVTLVRLFFILLVLSHLLCLEAVPVTRTENLMQDLQVQPTLKNAHKEPTITERMDLELNDYAPSGANGRHTPRGP